MKYFIKNFLLISSNSVRLTSFVPIGTSVKYGSFKLSFGKPFALIGTATWLNDSAPFHVFGEDLQVLWFDKRMKFLNNGVVQDKITFKSVYYCWNFLPKPNVCRALDVPKKKRIKKS